MVPNLDKRPLRLTAAAALSLAMSLWNLIRFINSIISWPVLVEYHSSPGPLYIASFAAIWFFLGLAAAWGIWTGVKWGKAVAVTGTIGYALWYWLDLFVVRGPNADRPFNLGVSAVLAALMVLVLFSPKADRYFKHRAVHERESKNR